MLTVQPFSVNFPFPYWLVTQSTVYSYIIIIKLRQTTEEVMMMRTKYTQSARELAIRAYKVKFFFIFKELLFSVDFASCTIMSGLNCKKTELSTHFIFTPFLLKENLLISFKCSFQTDWLFQKFDFVGRSGSGCGISHEKEDDYNADPSCYNF